jgi:hypothetical protein
VVSDYGSNEIVVDGRGNVYVNSCGFDIGCRRAAEAREDCLETSGIELSPGRRRDRVSEWDGDHARQPDADRVEVVRWAVDAFDIHADGGLARGRPCD